MRLPRLARIGCACLVVSLALASCGHAPSIGDTAAARPTLTVGVLNAVDCATAFIAQDHGYFAAEGLNVDFQVISPGTKPLTLLHSGAVTIAFDDNLDVFGSIAHGDQLHLAADAYQLAPQVQPILAMPGATINTPRDLAGKRIGLPTTSAVQTLLINELVRAYDVDPGSLHYVAVPYQSMGQALARGAVDAIAPVEPFTTEAESGYGAQVVADTDTGVTQGVPLSGYVSTQTWASAHSGVLAAFRRAMQRAATDAAQRVVVEGALTSHEQIDPKVAAIVHLGAFPVSVSAARLQRIVDLMREAKQLSRPIDLAAMTS